MIKKIFGVIGAVVGVIIISNTVGLIIFGAVHSVKNFTLTERLVGKVDQLEERIMHMESMVARGDNKCGG